MTRIHTADWKPVLDATGEPLRDADGRPSLDGDLTMEEDLFSDDSISTMPANLPAAMIDNGDSRSSTGEGFFTALFLAAFAFAIGWLFFGPSLTEAQYAQIDALRGEYAEACLRGSTPTVLEDIEAKRDAIANTGQVWTCTASGPVFR